MISAGMASPVFRLSPACPINAPTRLCVRLSIARECYPAPPKRKGRQVTPPPSSHRFSLDQDRTFRRGVPQ